MLRRPKHSKIEVVAPKEEEEEKVIQGCDEPPKKAKFFIVYSE